MKKLNNNQKEKIVYFVTAMIIVSILIAVICNLSIVKASAADDAVITVVNGSQNLEWQDVPNNEIVDPWIDNPAGRIEEFEDMYYNTDPYEADNGDYYIPDFIVGKTIATGGNETVNLGVINYHIIFIMRVKDPSLYNIITVRGWYKDYLHNTNKYTEMQYIYLNENYTLVSYTINDIEDSLDNLYVSNMHFNFDGTGSNVEVAGYVIGYDLYECAKQAVAICEYENYLLNPPTNVVYGTEDIVKSITSIYTRYIPQGISIPWNKFYLGFICSAVINNEQVQMLYTVVYNDNQYNNGEFIILDESYHDYILEINIEGAVLDGQIELEITNTNEFDIKYIAVSDSYDLLSTDLITKVNLYNDEINADNEKYKEAYSKGYSEGLKNGSIGPFANSEMTVTYNIKNLETNEISEYPVKIPIEVNAGGLSFEQIWNWYDSNIKLNNTAISSIDVYINFTKPILWKNTLFYYGNNSDSETFIPNYTYVRTAGTTGEYIYTTYINPIGNYYYLTLDDAQYTIIDRLNFTITNEEASYYDILVTNKLTLYTDINQVIIDENSYLMGEENGYKNGYDYGFSQGELQAQTVAFSEGREAGFADGRTVGYNEGYEQGLQDDFRFYDLFFSLFDAQLNTFKSVVSFEIFGINVAGFILGLVTIGIVAFVIRKVW